MYTDLLCNIVPTKNPPLHTPNRFTVHRAQRCLFAMICDRGIACNWCQLSKRVKIVDVNADFHLILNYICLYPYIFRGSIMDELTIPSCLSFDSQYYSESTRIRLKFVFWAFPLLFSTKCSALAANNGNDLDSRQYLHSPATIRLVQCCTVQVKCCRVQVQCCRVQVQCWTVQVQCTPYLDFPHSSYIVTATGWCPHFWTFFSCFTVDDY